MKKPMNPKRRALLLGGLASGVLPRPVLGQTGFTAGVTLALDRLGGPVNPSILGNNVEWVYNGDGLLRPNSLEWNPPVVEAARSMAPTVLRYPGGSHADFYHWRDGIGPLSNRRQNEHFFNRERQTVLMGTQEMLELCETTGAYPLFTANAITGTPEEAAEWVRYVNTPLISRATGRPLFKVLYWEIGNEPYLRETQRPETWISPEVFAERATALIRAMKAADPTIRVGIPLRSDRLGGVPATPWQGFNDKVLRLVGADIDFVALHNAYLPFGYDRSYSRQEWFLASMAATRVVEADFAATRQQLVALRPGRHITLSVTEHNAMYTLSGAPTDAYLATWMGALYAADLLRLFTQTPDLLMANFWSLCGNWYFGAVDQFTAAQRPQFHVLRLFRGLWLGRVLPLSITTRTFSNPRVGFTPAMSGTPTVSGAATRDGPVVRVLLINKDPSASASVTVNFPGGGRPLRSALYFLRANDPLATQLAWEPSNAVLGVRTDSVRFPQPRHSIAFLELTLPA